MNQADDDRSRPRRRDDDDDDDDGYDDRPRRRRRRDEDDDDRPRRRPVSQGASVLAILALVLGILSITGGCALTGIPAIICGVVARKSPGGGGFSLAGIILGPWAPWHQLPSLSLCTTLSQTFGLQLVEPKIRIILNNSLSA